MQCTGIGIQSASQSIKSIKQEGPHFLFSVPTKSFKEGSDEERHTFVTGDVVEVAEGDLANLKGTVLSIDGNKITIMPKHDDLKV